MPKSLLLLLAACSSTPGITTFSLTTTSTAAPVTELSCQPNVGGAYDRPIASDDGSVLADLSCATGGEGSVSVSLRLTLPTFVDGEPVSASLSDVYGLVVLVESASTDLYAVWGWDEEVSVIPPWSSQVFERGPAIEAAGEDGDCTAAFTPRMQGGFWVSEGAITCTSMGRIEQTGASTYEDTGERAAGLELSWAVE